MGTPTASEPEMKPIDPTVGGLVWVRRRNGSWWPGQIVGADELSDDSLVSPKSGTPVKLLGKVNASVDWYNLDKSKRVKAFRCGEYDDCIERAKASSSCSSKKNVKYARKEDAILQALELEGGFQSKDNPNICSELDMNDVEQHVIKESEMSDSTKESGHMGEQSGCIEDNSKLKHGWAQSVKSSEATNHESEMAKQLPQGRRHRTPNDSEDDGTEGVKRMKGLDDLGMGVVSSLKRKRSQVAHVQEFLKRKQRSRPLTKVLESTAMVSVPVISEGISTTNGLPLTGVSDIKVSGVESKDSMGSFSGTLNNSYSTGVSCENGFLQNASEYPSDAPLTDNYRKGIGISSTPVLPESDSNKKLIDVPFLREENKPAGITPVSVSHSSSKTQVGADIESSRNSQVETVSLDNEVAIECGSTSLAAADIDGTNPMIEQISSKWQSKGKRNIRHKNMTKRRDLSSFLDVRKDEDPDISLPSVLADEFHGQNGDVSQKAPRRLMPCRQSRFVLNPKYESLESPIRKFDSNFGLFDVYLDVDTDSRPRHVPYISLMSRLHGRPITGHPLTVEVMEEGALGSRTPKKQHWVSTSCVNVSPGKSSKARKNGKIRKLSTLNGSQKRREDRKRPLLSKLNGPAIPCIPLKVVFIRCLEALHRIKRSQGNI